MKVCKTVSIYQMLSTGFLLVPPPFPPCGAKTESEPNKICIHNKNCIHNIHLLQLDLRKWGRRQRLALDYDPGGTPPSKAPWLSPKVAMLLAWEDRYLRGLSVPKKQIQRPCPPHPPPPLAQWPKNSLESYTGRDSLPTQKNISLFHFISFHFFLKRRGEKFNKIKRMPTSLKKT